MSLFLDIKRKQYRIGIWKIEESVEQLLTLLPSDKGYSEKIREFGAERRQKEWLAVRVLLHHMASENAEIDYDCSGKPLLRGGAASLSISHTDGYAALLIAEAGACPGIDIERYRERVRGIREKFLSEREGAGPVNDLRTLIFYWSAKECIYKSMNRKVVDFVNEIYIPPVELDEKGNTEAFSFTESVRSRYELHYQFFDDFILTMIYRLENRRCC